MNLLKNSAYLEDVRIVAEDSNINFEVLAKKTMLVTGASGLICSFLIDVLAYRNEYYGNNIKIYMLCRHKDKLLQRFSEYSIVDAQSEDSKSSLYCYVEQDINESLTIDVDFDYIVHGASNTHPKLYASDPVDTITTNVIGLNNLLQYSVKHHIKRILMMSSVEIYGKNLNDTKYFDERYCGYIDCNTVRAGYPEAKRLGESLCQAYIAQYDLDVVIGRLSRVYGPSVRSDDSKAMSQFINNALAGEDIVLKSEGKQEFSYLYAADAVSGILTILAKGESGEAYNISDQASDIKLKDLASLIAEKAGRKVIFDLPDATEAKGFSTATIALMDSSKLKALGWNANYDIKQGLTRTMNILGEK